jgi:hypothetical protein
MYKKARFMMLLFIHRDRIIGKLRKQFAMSPTRVNLLNLKEKLTTKTLMKPLPNQGNLLSYFTYWRFLRNKPGISSQVIQKQNEFADPNKKNNRFLRHIFRFYTLFYRMSTE